MPLRESPALLLSAVGTPPASLFCCRGLLDLILLLREPPRPHLASPGASGTFFFLSRDLIEVILPLPEFVQSLSAYPGASCSSFWLSRSLLHLICACPGLLELIWSLREPPGHYPGASSGLLENCMRSRYLPGGSFSFTGILLDLLVPLRGHPTRHLLSPGASCLLLLLSRSLLVVLSAVHEAPGIYFASPGASSTSFGRLLGCLEPLSAAASLLELINAYPAVSVRSFRKLLRPPEQLFCALASWTSFCLSGSLLVLISPLLESPLGLSFCPGAFCNLFLLSTDLVDLILAVE